MCFGVSRSRREIKINDYDDVNLLNVSEVMNFSSGPNSRGAAAVGTPVEDGMIKMNVSVARVNEELI